MEDKSRITNPKPKGQKHYENTSEMSKPHSSKGEPEEHVDSMAFGEGGKRAPEYDVDHIKDDGAKQMGKETHELHQKNK